MKKEFGNENVKSASESRNENYFLGLFDQNAQFSGAITIRLASNKSFSDVY